MYNHYIPGANGVFERTVVDDRPPPPPPVGQAAFAQSAMPPSAPSGQSEFAQGVISPPPRAAVCETPREPPQADVCEKDEGGLHFLRRLLPRGIDLGDLLVLLIVLVLLIDSDQDDMWTVLITAAILLF